MEEEGHNDIFCNGSNQVKYMEMEKVQFEIIVSE